MQLFDYQERMIGEAREALRHHNSVLMQAPTGAGKTVLASFMLGGAAKKGLRSWFICHRRELVEQTAKTFDKISLPYGFIASGYPSNPFSPVQICSVDTLKARMVKQGFSAPSLVLWDESHHVGAAGWAAVKSALPNAKHVGLSATPERLDGRGLDEFFSHMIMGPPVADLIRRGFLSDYRLIAPGTPDLTGIKKQGGDFAKGQLEDALLNGQRAIIGDIVKHWRKHAYGKRTIGFAASIKHSQAIVEQFRHEGIMALHLDATTPAADRKAATMAFAAGQIQVLMNVDLFGEGYDLAAHANADVTIEAVICARPTQSLGLHLQQVGRALRRKSQPAIILDHAGNWQRHGLPDDEREWSLAGRERKKQTDEKDIPTRQCGQCFAVHRPSPTCPHCGHVYPVANRAIEQVDGDLVEIDKEAVRRQRLQEQAQARDIDSLIKLAITRGYKHPEKWAAHIFTARQAKRREQNFSRS